MDEKDYEFYEWLAENLPEIKEVSEDYFKDYEKDFIEDFIKKILEEKKE